jgi:hypothetical protein
MFRSRWMSLILAAGLLTSCGCCCFQWPERPWFGRRCCNNGYGNNGGGCCNNGSGEMVFSEGETFSSQGPILMDSGPPTYTGQGPILGQPPGAQTTEPQMAPMPRLIPTPTPAPPSPNCLMKKTSVEVPANNS